MSIRLLGLKILRTYIQANLASRFIILFKFFTDILILFAENKNGSLFLFIDYQKLNNSTNKNCYILLLISELLNYSSCTNNFIILDPINTYYCIKI